jgi:hypothetical protein
MLAISVYTQHFNDMINTMEILPGENFGPVLLCNETLTTSQVVPLLTLSAHAPKGLR